MRPDHAWQVTRPHATRPPQQVQQHVRHGRTRKHAPRTHVNSPKCAQCTGSDTRDQSSCTRVESCLSKKWPPPARPFARDDNVRSTMPGTSSVGRPRLATNATTHTLSSEKSTLPNTQTRETTHPNAQAPKCHMCASASRTNVGCTRVARTLPPNDRRFRAVTSSGEAGDG